MKRALIFVIALLLISSTAVAAPVSFAGVVNKDTTWFDPYDQKKNYKISTESQLIGLCSLVNEEQTGMWKPSHVEHFEGVTFTLTRDIELTQPWTPIGSDDTVYFAGIFDGNGHTISGLNVQNSYGGSGLFGYLSGEVRNLNVKGKNESYDSNSAGVAGILSKTGKISNCTSAVNVKGLDKCGGIVGNNEGGTIERSINIGSISGTYKIGGIVGENWDGIVSQCGNHGKIKSTRRGVATYGTGGVAGRSVSADAEIIECYNIGDIHSNTEATGGVAGYMNGSGSTLKDCYNTGTLNIDIKSSDKEMSPAYVGGVVGIAGINGVVIRNCYNTGIINNPDISGGVIGRYRNISEYEIETSYITNNYYVTRAFSSGIGLIDNTKDDNIDKAATGVSAANMHNLMSSLSVAFIKDTGSYGNNGYPVLRWQEPVTTAEKEFFDMIPVDKQEFLDQYMVDNAGKRIYGQVIMDILSPQNLTTNAFILYMEAQDKIEELKEKETKKNEQQ